ncbi:MAG: hypothetical protein M3069_22125 [Chloroflexota bacterium]|nr:hypothetical protein [Chloroflexota bacterium]
MRRISPTGPLVHARRRKQLADDLVWDEQAEQDATQLAGLLFMAATPLSCERLATTFVAMAISICGERSSCRFRREKKPSTMPVNDGTRTGLCSRSKSTWRAASSGWRLANFGPLSMAVARGQPSHSHVPARSGSAC